VLFRMKALHAFCCIGTQTMIGPHPVGPAVFHHQNGGFVQTSSSILSLISGRESSYCRLVRFGGYQTWKTNKTTSETCLLPRRHGNRRRRQSRTFSVSPVNPA
jgi:hypothetical protein